MADRKITQKDVLDLPDGKYCVDQGLYLCVQKGRRRFLFRYQYRGKRKEIGVGSAVDVSLARAKMKVVRFRQALVDGVDPKTLFNPVSDDEKLNSGSSLSLPNEEKRRTFDEIWPEAVEVTDRVRKWKNEKHRWQWSRNIEMYASPIIGTKPIGTITRDDIIAILEPIWYTKTDTAAKLRGKLERVFAYAIFKGEYNNANPAIYKGNLDMVLPPPSKVYTQSHREAMTLDEMKEICAKFWTLGRSSHMAVLMGILTALRAKEFTFAQWSEFDFNENVWHVPAERQKVSSDTAFRVPLSRQVLAVLDRCRLADPEMSGYVFKSVKREGEPLSPQTPMAMLNKHLDRHVTMHGCRSTFRSWCEETEQNWFAAEKSLMHEEQKKVVRAYQRSDLLDIRRELMQEWADEVLPMSIIEAAL